VAATIAIIRASGTSGVMLNDGRDGSDSADVGEVAVVVPEVGVPEVIVVVIMEVILPEVIVVVATVPVVAVLVEETRFSMKLAMAGG